MKLPNAERAFVDIEKLRKTLLEAAKNCDAVPGVEDQYGRRYIVDFMMTTAKGQAKIRSTWIVLRHETFPRLTSCYILKKED